MGLDLTVFPQRQQMIIVSLLEEIERLKERIEALERERDKTQRLWEPAYTQDLTSTSKADS